MVSSPHRRRRRLEMDIKMTDRPNETSGALPPRPDDAASTAPPAPDGDAGAARPEGLRGAGNLGYIALIIVGVAASPWWAPVIAPLLPWSASTAPVQTPPAATQNGATPDTADA